MKKAFRNIVLFVVAVVLIAALAGCNQEPAAQYDGKLQINTIKFMPYAYLGESFDLREVLLMEEGVEYSATALYVDISAKTEHILEVNDLCFTPEAIAETVVVLSAKRGSETASKAIYIPTTIRAEPLDDLYKSSGTLGGSDPGISKSVNIDPLYLKGEGSTTSLHVSFNGTDPHPYGNLFMSFASPDAQEYFTDKTWENAIVTFWVYNPMDQDIEFQLRIVDETAGTNIDWQTVDGPHKQRAAAGQWTQLFFSLRKLGTTNKLTTGKFTKDMCSLKFRYDGYNTTETYSFDFYMDGIDVVDGSVYPEVDTKYVLSNEKIEQGWENMKMDTGWQGVYTEYDYETFYGEGSTCALKATFPGEKGKTNSFICLSPEAQFDELPDMTGGKLTAYFKFENMDKKVFVDILNKKWETSNKIEMPLTPVGDGWYRGVIDLEDVEVGSGRNDNIIRIRFHFSGVSESSVVYMDSVNYAYKYVNKVLEAASVDWINLPTDRGAYYWNVDSKYVTTHLKGSNTVRSLHVTAPDKAAGKFTFSTQAAVSSGDLSAEPNMTKGTLGAWFYFGKQLPNASMRVTSDNWKGSVALPFVFTQNPGDGWYYGELHGSDIEFTESANASKVLRITIDIPQGYDVYIDNLHWKAGVEETLTAAEIDPSVLFDGGDFLAGTDILSYDKHHWDNVINDDGKPNTQEGLTCGVDTKNVYGAYSVRSWYFKAAASNSCANAIAQLKFAKGYDMTGKLLAFDIRIDSEGKVQQEISMRLHTAGWSDINTINKSIKLNADERWKTVVVDFSDVYLEKADITNFGMISFYFNFALNTGKDRAIYIDNVRLIKPDQIPEGAITKNETAEPLEAADLYDGGDFLANTNNISHNVQHWENVPNAEGVEDTQKGLTCGVDTTNVYGPYSVRSWYFKAAADNKCVEATAQLNFAQSYDITGKLLAFDIRIDSEGKVQQLIGLRLHNSGWGNLNVAHKNIKLNADEKWKTVVLDLSDVFEADADLTDFKMLTFYFDFAANTGKDRAIYIDNVRVVAPNEIPAGAITKNETPEPLNAADLFDGGDLLAGSDTITYEKHHWDNIVNDDGKPNTQQGLTCGVDTANVTGPYSVRSWYFKAAAANNCSNAIAQFKLAQSYDLTGKLLAFDIRIDSESKMQQGIQMRLHTAGWSDINTINKAIKLNADEAWKTVVMDFSDVYKEGADITNFGMISFYFDFAANTGKDRAIYIDNVRLVASDEIPAGAITKNEEPEPVTEADLYDGGDFLASTNNISHNVQHWENIPNAEGVEDTQQGLTCGVDTTNVTGPYSVRSWYFKAAAANACSEAVAQLRFAQSYDMTGKHIAFDIKIDSDSKIQQAIGVRLHMSNWGNINNVNKVIKLNADETWKTIVLDISDRYLPDADLTVLQFISFYFDFAANTGKDRAIYIDNVRLVKADEIPADAVTSDETPEPLVPADLYDGGDLLATAYPANGDDKGIFDGSGNFSYDAQSNKVYDGNEVGAYSVKSWSFTSVKTEDTYPTALLDLGKSVNMNGKVLAADVFFENTKGTVALYSLHNTGWSSLNTSDNQANYQQKTAVGKWMTVYFDITQKIADGKDLSDVRFLKFQFYFDATAGQPRTVYIDNVRLVDPSTVPPADDVDLDWTNMTQDTGSYYQNMTKNDFTTDHIKGEHSIQSLNVVAPDDTAGFFTFNLESALQRGEIEKPVRMDAGTLGAWFYFGDQEPSATLKLTEAGWTVSSAIAFTFGEGQDGWYYGTVDGKQIVFSQTETPQRTIRATITIPAGYDICIDSMTFKEDADYADSMTDLLGGATADDTAWTPESGLNVAKDSAAVNGNESYCSWAFKASAVVDAAASAKFDLGKNVDMSGKYLVWDVLTALDQNIAVTLYDENGDALTSAVAVTAAGTSDWSAVLVNVASNVLAEKDLTAVRHVEFSFDFAANTGTDRAVNIDNLRLVAVDDANDWIHKYVAGEVNGTAALNTEYVKAERSTASLMLAAPADSMGSVMFNVTGLDFEMKHRGTLKAWFHFGDQAAKADLISIESGANHSTPVPFTFGTGTDGWYEGTVNLADLSYAAEVTPGVIKSLEIKIPQGCTVYIDGMSYTDITEDAAYDLIQTPTDLVANVKPYVSLTSEKVLNEQSVQSMRVDAKDGNRNVRFKPTSSLNFNNGKLTVWIYGGDTAPAAKIAIYDASSNTGMVAMSIGESVNGWYLATLDIPNDIPENKRSVDFAAVTQFIIQVQKHTDTGTNGVVYLDDMKFTPNPVVTE